MLCSLRYIMPISFEIGIVLLRISEERIEMGGIALLGRAVAEWGFVFMNLISPYRRITFDCDSKYQSRLLTEINLIPLLKEERYW